MRWTKRSGAPKQSLPNSRSGSWTTWRGTAAFVKGYRTPWTPGGTDRTRGSDGRRPWRPIRLEGGNRSHLVRRVDPIEGQCLGCNYREHGTKLVIWAFDVLDWLLNQEVANNVANALLLLVEFASDRASGETMA